MLRCLSSRRFLRCLPGAALSLALVTLAAAPAAAQSTNPKPPVERYDDPVGNGIAIGAALGAITGVAITGALYAHCNDLCDAPAEAADLRHVCRAQRGCGRRRGLAGGQAAQGQAAAWSCPSPSTSGPIARSARVHLQWRF